MHQVFRLFLKARHLLAAASLFVAVPAQADSVPVGFEVANQAYGNADFKAARDGYQALVKSGQRSANLFYNLGNADYRLGEKGAAILNYERALALDPSHPEAKANLQLVREETGARFAVPNLWQKALLWPQTVTRQNAAWIAAAAVWVVCFSLIPVFGKRRVAWVPALLGLVALGWAGGAVAWEASQGAAWIVTAMEGRARTAPADTSKTAGVLPPGSRVQLLLDRGEWLYVLLPDSNRGWIARGELEPVAPGV